MCCRIVDMREKQVICIKDGTILGCVCDVEVDTCNGKLVSIVIFGKSKCFGLFGREEDSVIPWNCIEVIGKDTILVNCDPPRPRRRCKRGPIGSLFNSSCDN
ncbi:MAG: YlmC/YmxH family sporulation protein [Oscillospiraceae bacterium]|nr:YlmC/YmxH family sporulation protein [Oscillospiraceae bacterium]